MVAHKHTHLAEDRFVNLDNDVLITVKKDECINQDLKSRFYIIEGTLFDMFYYNVITRLPYYSTKYEIDGYCHFL